MDIHVINVNSDALKFITEALSKNPGMYPRIVLRSGGCAGNMLLTPSKLILFTPIRLLKSTFQKELFNRRLFLFLKNFL